MYPKEIIRYLSGECSTEDEEIVQQWLREDPSRKVLLEELREIWKLAGRLDIGNEEQAWLDLKSNAIKGGRKKPYQEIDKL